MISCMVLNGVKHFYNGVKHDLLYGGRSCYLENHSRPGAAITPSVDGTARAPVDLLNKDNVVRAKLSAAHMFAEAFAQRPNFESNPLPAGRRHVLALYSRLYSRLLLSETPHWSSTRLNHSVSRSMGVSLLYPLPCRARSRAGPFGLGPPSRPHLCGACTW